MKPLGKALLGLHAWGGLIFSWLLVPIFLAGSLAVFEPEISHWLRPEIRQTAVDQATAIDLAEARLRSVGSEAAFWRIRLPNDREPSIGIGWGPDPRRLREETLDAASGRPLAVRASAGGHFFTELHSELLLGNSGKWLVGAIGIFMLAAIASGLLIHHRLLRDFFTFRPRANRRRTWLDAHNLAGVATLPFLLMITYTGVVILAETFMPAATHALYDGQARANRAEVVKTFERPASGMPADALPLRGHLQAAEAQLGQGKITNLLVRHQGDRAALVQAYRSVDDRLSAVADHATFDSVDGTLFGQQVEWNAMAYAYRAQVGLHVAHFGGPAIRWTYFLSGLLGAALMAAGTLVFLRKRRQRHGDDRSQHLLDAVSATAVSGGILACLALFWANRLLPATADGRAGLEVAAVFAVWALAFGHALWRGRRAWREQLLAAALLGLTLPPLDLFTAGAPDALRHGLDLVAALLGGLLLLAALRLFPREIPS